MPREGFQRKREKAGAGGPSRRDFHVMTPDEPTPTMQNPESYFL
jgi:hypothetical protein